jgi:anti-sigma factor (TIGR02949 family)
MDCDEVLSELEHYLHGELDTERSLHLAEHLAACSPCFDRAEFQRRFRDIVRSKCRSSKAPEHLVVRVRMAIRSETRESGPGGTIV